MTNKEFTQNVLNGQMLIAGEYRSSKAEQITYRDKVSKIPVNMVTLRHVVEFGPDSVVVRERVPDDFKWQTYQPPFKKGARVVLHLTSMLREKGMVQAGGMLEVLAD